MVSGMVWSSGELYCARANVVELENGPFWDQNWVKNGSKMCFSKSDPGPFGVHNQVKQTHFELALSHSGPSKVPKTIGVVCNNNGDASFAEECGESKSRSKLNSSTASSGRGHELKEQGCTREQNGYRHVIVLCQRGCTT